MPAGTINVARPGPWGNPFKVGLHGTQQWCVDRHADLLAGLLLGGPPLDIQRRLLAHAFKNMSDFVGRDVACWCGPDQPCHGDNYLALAKTNLIRWSDLDATPMQAIFGATA